MPKSLPYRGPTRDALRSALAATASDGVSESHERRPIAEAGALPLITTLLGQLERSLGCRDAGRRSRRCVPRVGLLVYGWLEAGWLRTPRRSTSRFPELPAALDGLRIGHLSDFHLGAAFSRGNSAGEARGATGSRNANPDIVCITGDLVSHPAWRASAPVAALPGSMPRLSCSETTTWRSRAIPSRRPPSCAISSARACSVTRPRRSTCAAPRIVVVGVDPETYRRNEARPHELRETAALRLLLCHFPGIVHRIPRGSFDLILAGHLHAGQICLPLPGRRITLAHPRARFRRGRVRDAGRGDARLARARARPSSLSGSSLAPR